jgi:hypothetical protein
VSRGLVVISIPLSPIFFVISPMLKAPCLGCLSLHINLRDLLRQNHGSLISFAAFEKVIVVSTAMSYFYKCNSQHASVRSKPGFGKPKPMSIFGPCTSIFAIYSVKITNWRVSSVPFPFRFPFQLHCELVSSGISSKSVQKNLELVSSDVILLNLKRDRTRIRLSF